MVFVLPIRLSPLPGLFLRGVLQANRFRYTPPVGSRFHALIQFHIATPTHVSIPPLPYQKGQFIALPPFSCEVYDQIAVPSKYFGYIDFALASAVPSRGIWICYNRECLLANFQP